MFVLGSQSNKNKQCLLYLNIIDTDLANLWSLKCWCINVYHSFFSICISVNLKKNTKKERSCKETHTKLITTFYLILALWSKVITTKIKGGHTYSTQLISDCLLHCSVFLPVTTHVHCHCSFHSNTCIILFTPCVIKHTLSNTIICKTHAHIFLQNAQSHTFKQSCTQWAPAYLRLLLLGCDPARPGWSGLWRFWRETGHQQSTRIMCEFMMAELCLECKSRFQTKIYINNYKLIQVTTLQINAVSITEMIISVAEFCKITTCNMKKCGSYWGAQQKLLVQLFSFSCFQQQQQFSAKTGSAKPILLQLPSIKQLKHTNTGKWTIQQTEDRKLDSLWMLNLLWGNNVILFTERFTWKMLANG